MAGKKFRNSELSRRIDEVILECLEKGEPTVEEVSAEVFRRYGNLVAQYANELAFSHIRSIVSDRMKKLLATETGHALQLKLGIAFKGLEPESAMTFLDDRGKIRYVATVRATEKHHRRYITLLRKQIKADTKRLRVAEAFYARLKPAFDKYPGITTGEAIKLIESGQIDPGDQVA